MRSFLLGRNLLDFPVGRTLERVINRDSGIIIPASSQIRRYLFMPLGKTV